MKKDMRFTRSLRVGEKMKELYLEKNEGDLDGANEMFILGLLHDIGFELNMKPTNYNYKAGVFLKNQGYKYWKEVYYHGVHYVDYYSDALDLLNEAYFSVGSNGEDLGFAGYLAEIENKYGIESAKYVDAFLITEKLRKKKEEKRDQEEKNKL